MVNNCAVRSCKNDYRSQHRYIIMPHVASLRFHKPSAESFSEWYRLLHDSKRRPGWSTIVVCSNHFRYGKPLAESQVPELYLDGYPEWVEGMIVPKVHQMIRSLEPELCGQAVQDIIPTLHHQIADRLLKQLLAQQPPIFPSSIIERLQLAKLPAERVPQVLSNAIKYLSPEKDRKLLDLIFMHTLPGVALGVLVKVKLSPGADIFWGTGTPSVMIPVAPEEYVPSPLSLAKVKHAPVELEKCCQCTAEQPTFHDYSLRGFLSWPECRHMKDCHKSKVVRLCKKKLCKVRRSQSKFMKKKVTALSRKVAHLEAEKQELLQEIEKWKKQAKKKAKRSPAKDSCSTKDNRSKSKKRSSNETENIQFSENHQAIIKLLTL